MPYGTDEKLKSFLDTNQLHREQMCLAILSLDRRYNNIRPRHPRGGPDGGRDIEALSKDGNKVFGAVGFINQAADTNEQKRQIKQKFLNDLHNAVEADDNPEVFLFFTNINLTLREKDELIQKTKDQGISHCEIFDRERLRISLDSADGLSARFQYLNIPLSEAEQASFFARWGDDIQSIISTGFQKIENTLDRLLFLQEAHAPINSFIVSIELDKVYSADEIGHFRFFCYIHLVEMINGIQSLLFGCTDKNTDRIKCANQPEIKARQLTGIKHGICGGQWELRPNESKSVLDDIDEEYVKVSSFTQIGQDEVKFIPIQYGTSDFFRIQPYLSLRNINDAVYAFWLNKSLAEKVKVIHIYSNGYKLKEIGSQDFSIDKSHINSNEDETSNFPMPFTNEELSDSWVVVRPKKSTLFKIDFYNETPKRVFEPIQITNSLEIK